MFCCLCRRNGAKWRAPMPELKAWKVCDPCHEYSKRQLSAWMGEALNMLALGVPPEQVQSTLCDRIERGERPPTLWRA